MLWLGPGHDAAERDLGMAKIQQKVSGTVRSTAGARAFAACRSYLQTAAKTRAAKTCSSPHRAVHHRPLATAGCRRHLNNQGPECLGVISFETRLQFNR